MLPKPKYYPHPLIAEPYTNVMAWTHGQNTT